MNKIMSIGKATEILCVHVQTLRNWERAGKLKPDSISPGGTRRYNLDKIIAISGKEIRVETDTSILLHMLESALMIKKKILQDKLKFLKCIVHQMVLSMS